MLRGAAVFTGLCGLAFGLIRERLRDGARRSSPKRVPVRSPWGPHSEEPRGTRGLVERLPFTAKLFLLVSAAVLRSSFATRRDGFTIDEAYHIAAGASYIRDADFRINPEHPPLVKLWVGALVLVCGFRLRPLRQFADKPDERTFAQEDVFLDNDPDAVQRRSRVAMFGLNGFLLFVLGLALRRSFGAGVALRTLVFLAIDPTVSAHLPVVMTDLPVALLSAAAVVAAARSFRSWCWPDVLACSALLGLALGAKHSALAIYIPLGLMGAILAAATPLPSSEQSRFPRFIKLAAMLCGSLFVLWALYFFRFFEGASKRDVFNRALADKIADIRSSLLRFALRNMVVTRILPRAYIWGLADTLHAGIEGRAYSQLAFGRLYFNKAPRYFFPGLMLVKLPIGLIVLAAAGILLVATGRLPGDWKMPTALVLLSSSSFLAVLSSGSTYAGIRHALPAVVLLAIPGGISGHVGTLSSSESFRAITRLSFFAAALSALPRLRPWEYFNEFIGGPRNGYRYFDDESVDIGQRSKELAAYYHRFLLPAGKLPYLNYSVSLQERTMRKLDWVGRDPRNHKALFHKEVYSGTFLISARFISRRLWWDAASLRAARPILRFGNLLVFEGSFALPSTCSIGLYYSGLAKVYCCTPDVESAEQLLSQSVALDPQAFFIHIELGNVRLKCGLREGALRAYEAALRFAPKDDALRSSIRNQIDCVLRQPLDQITPLRNPALE